jgi:hypothetical protein
MTTDKSPPEYGIAGEDILRGQAAAIDKLTSEIVLYDDERTSPPIGTATVDIQAGKNVIYGRGKVGLDPEANQP